MGSVGCVINVVGILFFVIIFDDIDIVVLFGLLKTFPLLDSCNNHKGGIYGGYRFSSIF